MYSPTLTKRNEPIKEKYSTIHHNNMIINILINISIKYKMNKANPRKNLGRLIELS